MTNALSGLMSVKRTSVGASGSGGDRKYDTCKLENLQFPVELPCSWTLTGMLFSHKRLTLHTTIDGIDVKTVQCARLQVSDFSICVGGNGQHQGSHLSAVGTNRREGHPITSHLTGWTFPGDAELYIGYIIELQVRGCWDFLCGREVVDKWTKQNHT